MRRFAFRTAVILAAIVAAACSSTGRPSLGGSRVACMTVTSMLGAGAGLVVANQDSPKETDERLAKGGIGAVAGAALGYLVCGEGGAVNVLTAEIVATPPEGETPLSVTLSAEVPPDTRVESYEWDLGDGTRASGARISHTYRQPSDFGVRLVVTDTDGQTATATKRIAALKPPPPVSAAPRVLERVELGDVHFAFDSAQISEQGRSVLDGVAKQLRDYPERTVRSTGHTDAVGTEEYNLQLSERRAQSVVDYLSKDQGVSGDRFEVIGKGESSPSAPNDTGEGRSQNRRVDLEILETTAP